MTIDMPDWLRTNGATVNARLRAEAMCYFNGVSGHPRRAEYIWHCQIGNEIPVCAECCAWWRASVEKVESEPPVKIEEWTP